MHQPINNNRVISIYESNTAKKRNILRDITQLTFTCSKSAIETLEKEVKYV